MLKTQKVFWWRTGCANTEGKLGKEPGGVLRSVSLGHEIAVYSNNYLVYSSK